MAATEPKLYDLFVIGGGINGCGIARDAAGRGYSVCLAEMNDLASATSSSSTKLFHGGLRYLEYFEIRLVREALKERETLLSAMPHISWPMRFVLPVHKDMRFDNQTPASRVLSALMPWLKGRRPAWLIRFGLFLYDHLGGRKILPATTNVDLARSPYGAALKNDFVRAFEYSDCWVDDARLVVLNARDAHARGAVINVRTKVTSAAFENGWWIITSLSDDGKTATHRARMLINAGGPWVEDIIRKTVRLNAREAIRLVRGSHIVTRKLYDHDRCYFFQGTDGRIIFAIPYEDDFTLIGTTEAEHENPDQTANCTPEESEYLIDFANRYFKQPISKTDVVWTFSGVRPLYEDLASSASAATRDYVLRLDETSGGPLLNIFGGKITTYRRLAESALEIVDDALKTPTEKWTAGIPLPGGDFAIDAVGAQTTALAESLPFLNNQTVRRLVRQYGTEARHIFAGCDTPDDRGVDFGAQIFARELDWAVDKEWVRSAEDFLWRRTKLGLRVSNEQAAKIGTYIRERLAATT